MYRPILQHAPRRLCSAARTVSIGRRHASAQVKFNWEDPLDSASLFTEEEIAIQETARSYCQERMLPRVLGQSNPLPKFESRQVTINTMQNPRGLPQ